MRENCRKGRSGGRSWNPRSSSGLPMRPPRAPPPPDCAKAIITAIERELLEVSLLSRNMRRGNLLRGPRLNKRQKKARPGPGFAAAARNPYFVAAFFSPALALAFALAFFSVFFSTFEDLGDGVAGVAFLVSTPVCALGAAGVAGWAFGAWANAVSVNAEAINVTSSFFNMENPPVFENRSDRGSCQSTPEGGAR